MEDSCSHVSNFDSRGSEFFGVFDGHAGSSSSRWCEANFHRVLRRLAEKHSCSTQELLDKAFVCSDSNLVQENHIYSGSTAAVAIYKPKPGSSEKKGNLYCANVGDTRIVMSHQRRAVRLSFDHVPSNREENNRILRAGGFVAYGRVGGILAVTRSLGDEEMKKLIIGHPYTTKVAITDKVDFVVIASDGVWDVCSDQQAVDMIADMKDPQKAAEHLVEYALTNNSTDNLTAMVFRF